MHTIVLLATLTTLAACAADVDEDLDEAEPELTSDTALTASATTGCTDGYYLIEPRDGTGLNRLMKARACVSTVAGNKLVGALLLDTVAQVPAYVKATFRVELHRCSDQKGVAQYPSTGGYANEGENGGLWSQTHPYPNQPVYAQIRITSTFVRFYNDEDYSGGGTFISTAGDTCP